MGRQSLTILATTFVSATRLQATLSAALLAEEGTFTIASMAHLGFASYFLGKTFLAAGGNAHNRTVPSQLPDKTKRPSAEIARLCTNVS